MTVARIRAGTAAAIVLAGTFASFPSYAAPCIHYVQQERQAGRPAATVGECAVRSTTVRVGQTPAWNSAHVVRAVHVPPVVAPFPIPAAASRTPPVRDRLGLKPGIPVETPGASSRVALQEARPIPDSRKDVRVVGWKFLPDVDEEMDFQRIARGGRGPVVSSVHKAAALFGVVAARMAFGTAPVGEPANTAAAESASFGTQAVAGLD